MSWTGQRLNPGGGKIFHSSPDQPWSPLSLLYKGYCVPLPGINWSGSGDDHPPSI